MSTPYLGQIILFAGNFAPRGWAFCQGQILSIAQNTALFSILGTTYGGNGQTTFALPDLRGRVPLGPGQGPGLTPRTLGEQGGSETVTLISNQMPAHTHSLNASNTNPGDQPIPEGNVLGVPVISGQPANPYTTPNNLNTTMAPNAIGIAGGSQPHQNMQPFLALNYIIAMEGVYPSRN